MKPNFFKKYRSSKKNYSTFNIFLISFLLYSINIVSDYYNYFFNSSNKYILIKVSCTLKISISLYKELK